ncbi:MAG: PKD domain-containing protein, partial [Cytophagales bacterium]|nr:PKD domain-containing protein [Cytophagales bacterium]
MEKKLFLLFCIGITGTISFAQTPYKTLDERLLEKQIATKSYKSKIWYPNKAGAGQQSHTKGEIAKLLPPDPEQDCPYAIPVCQDTFVQPNSYVGFGNQQEIPGNTCLGENEKNSVWYVLNIQTGGNLEFVITPFDMNDDYDFALYNLTGANCSDISNGAITPVRCNYCVDPGLTGLSTSATNDWEDCCTNSPGCVWSNILPVNAGETYVLIVSNFSSTVNGYTLDFSPSTASIFDVIPPTPVSFLTVCGGDSLTLTLSEPVLCSSIAADGSDFTITGPGGPFTVTGAVGTNCGNFSIQVVVYFTPSLTIGSSYTITVTTGTDANTLIDNCGNAVADPTTLVYIAQPPPGSISGDNDICDGSSTILVASSGDSYLWNPGGATTQSITVSPTTTTTYDVVITNGTCSDNPSFTVTVLNAPVADFTFAPDPVCVGQQVNFTNNSSFPGCFFPFLFYTWNFGDGPPFSLAQDPNHTYSSAGTYNVTLTVTDLGFCGCSNEITIPVTVTAGGAPATPGAITGPTSVCPGQVGLVYSITAVAGATSYNWTVPAGATITAGQNTISITVDFGATSGNVCVTASNGCGTSTASCTPITVNALSASITSSSDITCNGFVDGTATVSSSGGTGAHSYLWLPSGGTNSTATGLGPGTYTVTVTDANFCQTTANITIIEPAALTASIISSSDITCNGFGDGTATVSSLGGTGIHSYSWSPSGGTNSTATGLGPGSYTVTVTDVNNCSTSANVTITEPSAITLSLTSNPATCGNNDGTATVAASGGVGSYTYLWDDLLAQTSPIATGLASGNYTVIVTDSNNCSQSGFVTVTDLGGATASAMLINEVNCFGGFDGAATVSVSGGTLPYTYNWSPGGGN